MFDNLNLPEDIKAKLEEEIKQSFIPKEEFEKVLSKKEELLSEKKKLAELKTQAEKEAEDRLNEERAKKGDLESLRKSYEEKIKSYEDKLKGMETEKKQNKILNTVKNFVSKTFVEDDLVREAITNEMSKRLDVQDGELVVVDDKGNLTANSIEDLKKEYLSGAKYSKHVMGSQASGSGATRSSKSTPASGKTDLKNIPLTDKQARLDAIRKRLGS